MAINPFVFGSFDKYNWGDKLRTVFGDQSTFIDPYTTGYQWLFFTGLPKSLEEQHGSFLTAICQSVTIPGITVNQISHGGTNNFTWQTPGTVEFTSKSFSVKMQEFVGLPTLSIVGQWVNIFRNMLTGTADLESGSASQGDYKGKAIYVTTMFDVRQVAFAAAFTGIYPTTVPTNNFSSDKTTHDKVEHEIEFSFDMSATRFGAKITSITSELAIAA